MEYKPAFLPDDEVKHIMTLEQQMSSRLGKEIVMIVYEKKE